MQITIDTNNLSEMDIAMLGFLAGQSDTEETVEETAPAPAPAKATPAKAKAAKPAPAPAPEPEEEDLLGGAPTMSDAVTAATSLVSSGGAAKVKAALALVGAKRVSEMKPEDIPAFLAALEG